MIVRMLLLAGTVTTLLTLASTPAGAIVVENPGENGFSGENTLAIHGTLPSTGQEVVLLKCAVRWDGTISESGHLSLDSIDFDAHAGSAPWCSLVDDCNATGWEGQIEEGHPRTDWEYAAHLFLCLEGFPGPPSSTLNGVVIAIVCKITNGELHCGGIHDGESDPAEQESFVTTFQVMPGILVPFFIEGELAIDSPLGLMHDE